MHFQSPSGVQSSSAKEVVLVKQEITETVGAGTVAELEEVTLIVVKLFVGT